MNKTQAQDYMSMIRLSQVDGRSRREKQEYDTTSDRYQRYLKGVMASNFFKNYSMKNRLMDIAVSTPGFDIPEFYSNAISFGDEQVIYKLDGIDVYDDAMRKAGLYVFGEARGHCHEASVKLSEYFAQHGIEHTVCTGGIHAYPTDNMMMHSWIEIIDGEAEKYVIDVANNFFVNKSTYNAIFDPEVKSMIKGKDLEGTLGQDIDPNGDNSLVEFLLTHPDNMISDPTEGAGNKPSNPTEGDE